MVEYLVRSTTLRAEFFSFFYSANSAILFYGSSRPEVCWTDRRWALGEGLILPGIKLCLILKQWLTLNSLLGLWPEVCHPVRRNHMRHRFFVASMIGQVLSDLFRLSELWRTGSIYNPDTWTCTMRLIQLSTTKWNPTLQELKSILIVMECHKQKAGMGFEWWFWLLGYTMNSGQRDVGESGKRIQRED